MEDSNNGEERFVEFREKPPSSQLGRSGKLRTCGAGQNEPRGRGAGWAQLGNLSGETVYDGDRSY